jgi:PAS domain-containing protein
MVACLVAFGCAGLLGLLRRSLVASARLDANIAELALSGDLLAPAGPGIPGPYHWAEGGPVSLARGWLPKGLEWKARILSDLNARLLERAKFVNFALRSVEDGLLIADPDGRITFANRSAGAILGVPARGLVGQNLQRLPGSVDAETLARLVPSAATWSAKSPSAGLRRCNTPCAWRPSPPMRRARARCLASWHRFPT